MSAGQSIGKREREVLTAIVETFISTGEPVGSRTLARSSREGLSPATIRNVMADLSDAGFLEQTHSSSGRIPTTDAYRYYVEQIAGRHQRCAGIYGAHVACALADITERGRHRRDQRRQKRFGACLLLAPGRSKGAGGVGDALGIGARPRVAARPAPGGTRSRGTLHQRELPRLDDGIDAHRTCATDRAGTQRVRPPDALHRAALQTGR